MRFTKFAGFDANGDIFGNNDRVGMNRATLSLATISALSISALDARYRSTRSEAWK